MTLTFFTMENMEPTLGISVQGAAGCNGLAPCLSPTPAVNTRFRTSDTEICRGTRVERLNVDIVR